ncbi:MAG TPA: hypothetical protein VEA37_02460, partial [Flavobacterium sp.]|nr:hypothetical protein [Flavobacterium sp.]
PSISHVKSEFVNQLNIFFLSSNVAGLILNVLLVKNGLSICLLNFSRQVNSSMYPLLNRYQVCTFKRTGLHWSRMFKFRARVISSPWLKCLLDGFLVQCYIFCFEFFLSSVLLVAIPITRNVKPIIKKTIPITGEESDEIDLPIRIIAAISITMDAERTRILLFFICGFFVFNDSLKYRLSDEEAKGGC